jgi:hypothetical protein
VWLTLTDEKNRRLTINFGNVLAFQVNEKETATLIHTMGRNLEKNYWYTVKETPDEILGMITRKVER